MGMPDNYAIADQFSLLSKLMDIHGENSFKAKSYSIAAFNIEKLPEPLSDIDTQKISSLKGIGDSVARKVIEILQTGRMKTLDEIILKTPPGVLEMMQIKGLGPKKINAIWKEMGIESIGELKYACEENRLSLFKGFGAKTQQNVLESINFYLLHQDRYLFADIEALALTFHENLRKEFPDYRFELTGEFRRRLEIINQLEWVTTLPASMLKDFLMRHSFKPVEEDDHAASFRGEDQILVRFYFSEAGEFALRLFETSCSTAFFESWHQKKLPLPENIPSEEDLFKQAGFVFIPAFLREEPWVLENREKDLVSDLVSIEDIHGIIHSHSNWSDGLHTIEEMARGCINKGYQYLVISDHSKAAAYANGLTEERIRAQHEYISELNEKLKPFRIFKSIECDILNDGAMDYSDAVLSTFDLVIASVHSNLKMTEDKAMMRLLRAIINPYTTIIGHLTGRLLLSRPGYPVNHSLVIEACIEHDVVIELNAHPRRLDMDWRWIHHAVEKGALISIDPDAHAVEGYEDVKYGVLAAQKAGLMKHQNLSSFSITKLEQFIANRRKRKNI